jgi:hypothetical protein
VAKKARTPAPPRPVQAPKRRVEPRQKQKPKAAPPGIPLQAARYWVIGGIAVLIVVGVILGVVVSKHGGSANAAAVAKIAKAAGGTFTTVPATRAALHITSFKTTVTYNSYPPTSGKHYYQPAVWNDYSQPVDPRQAVHNEEHGGIVIWYGPQISSRTRQEISRFYSESPNAMLVTPLPDTTPGAKFPPHKPLGSRVALTAWVGTSGAGHGYVMILPGFNEKAFKAFRDAFRGKGPERFPVNILTPGA